MSRADYRVNIHWTGIRNVSHSSPLLPISTLRHTHTSTLHSSPLFFPLLPLFPVLWCFRFAQLNMSWEEKNTLARLSTPSQTPSRASVVMTLTWGGVFKAWYNGWPFKWGGHKAYMVTTYILSLKTRLNSNSKMTRRLTIPLWFVWAEEMSGTDLVLRLIISELPKHYTDVHSKTDSLQTVELSLT